MFGYSISFTYPLLLLLILPLVGVALLLYFLSNKKYRRTRNRIISLVLHCVICVLCVFVLADIRINQNIPVESNEVIFVVDVSHSGDKAEENREKFLTAAIKTGDWYDGIKVGVVTFGFDQVYAVPLTSNVENVYENYTKAKLPSERDGTDIAAALTYTSELFTESASKKIVLVSDGKETDEEAMTVIRSLSSRGITMDTAYIPSTNTNNDKKTELQVIGVEFPDTHIQAEDRFTLGCKVYSAAGKSVNVEMYDNGELVKQEMAMVEAGTHSIQLSYSFAEDGFHELRFQVTSDDDILQGNNVYYSYYNVVNFNQVLILESGEGESEQLQNLLQENGDFEVDVMNVHDEDTVLPASAEELCKYDQVILNNIANKDLPAGFIDILYTYVNDYGGGMLTLGGTDESGENNAYNRSDMYGTTYQSMLPVEVINYTPPVAVMIIIDASGSMSETFGDDTRLAWARTGASACLDSLSERDYIGVMALNSLYDLVLPLTRRTQDRTIRNAISSIDETGGGTVFSEAINRAGTLLRAQTDVARRHIIIVTDGAVSGADKEQYMQNIRILKADGITLSVVGIGVEEGSSAAQEMQEACNLGGGRLHAVTDSDKLVQEMREDLNVPEIKDVNVYENGFNPIAYDTSSNLFNGIELLEGNKLNAVLGGFYGGKVRDSDYLVLAGDFEVPLYAQWKFGAGSVGSFMCDLNGGAWSKSFMQSEDGIRFIVNMVQGLMPVKEIEPNSFQTGIKTDNFINSLSIYNPLPDDSYSYRGSIVSADGSGDFSLSLNTGEGGDEDCYVITTMNAGNLYSMSNFVLKRPGVYQLVVELLDGQGNVIDSYKTYLEYSYSREYDVVFDQTREDPALFLQELAKAGSGEVIEDLMNPYAIYEDFVTVMSKQYDPRLVLLIIAIVLFLLDIAVRKFKFKWIHEIVRDYKQKKVRTTGRGVYGQNKTKGTSSADKV